MKVAVLIGLCLTLAYLRRGSVEWSVIPAANAREFFWQEGGIPLRCANVLICIW